MPQQPCTTGVLSVQGYLDVRSTRRVRDELYALMAVHERVVVDLADVDAVDLTGLRVLAAATRYAEHRGRQVVLRDPAPGVRRLLHVSRLARAVRVEVPRTPLADLA